MGHDGLYTITRNMQSGINGDNSSNKGATGQALTSMVKIVNNGEDRIMKWAQVAYNSEAQTQSILLLPSHIPHSDEQQWEYGHGYVDPAIIIKDDHLKHETDEASFYGGEEELSDPS
jgi:hypothetical protein